MLTYTLKKTPGHPLYEQLYQSIRDDIAAGRLPAGSRLPSKRVLAAHLGVSVVTVESAYAQLLAEGYAEARPRSGVYVCAIGSSVPVQPPHMPSLPQPTAPEPLFDLSGGTGEDVPFPASVWVRTMREVIADKRLMQPVDFAGAPELRAAIAAHLEQARGLRVSPEQIFIGAGTEYLYGLIVQLLGRRLRYAVEDPGYRKISGIYAANDVTVCPIGLDSEGLSVEALRASGAQIAHISPAHHYPTGIVMPIRRRNALLAWAAEAPERYIIEDDYDSELRHTGLPVPPLFSLDGQGRVLYLSTFSQTIAPSLRIAYLCLPPRLMERLRTQLGFYACAVPSFEQFTLARFIASGDYERHLNRLRKRFREKRAGHPGSHCGQLSGAALRDHRGKRRDTLSAAAGDVPLRCRAEAECRGARAFAALPQRLPQRREKQWLRDRELCLHANGAPSGRAGNAGRAFVSEKD